MKVAERYAKRLNCEVASIYKRRSASAVNEVEALGIMGDVDGRTCVIIDDMIDTAGTICSAVDTLFAAGAADVRCATTHAVFSGPAVDRLKNSRLSEVIVTNTIPLRDNAQQCKKIAVLSVARLLGQAMRNIHEETSVSSLFV